jgi:D-citramalate synthase
VLARIVELGDSKKTITIDDLPFIIAEVLDSKDYHHAELIACTVTSSLDLESIASIKLRLGAEVLSAAGSGNGGFAAFDNALARLVKRAGISLPPLKDFEVRIPKGGRSDALTECTITWETDQGDIKTRGVHANQVYAAIAATMRMLNIVMHRRLTERQGEEAGLPA